MSSPEIRYQSGFGNTFSTEAIPGALPKNQNNPQQAPLGLYAEQISGTAFTVPREHNLRSWAYRIRPSAQHSEFKEIDRGLMRSGPFNEVVTPPTQMRWDPMPENTKPTDFISSFVTLMGNGDPDLGVGSAIHLYSANAAMKDRFFFSADSEFLILPYEGRLLIRTEFGALDVKPGECALIPRGFGFTVDLPDGKSKGYVCENYGQPFRLPQLGPIGANGLANPRHFFAPVAAYEDRSGKFELLCKFGGRLWSAEIGHSPLDVVAWYGNYTPVKYDLSLFNTMGTVSFDHPDPSIFTVLTSPSSDLGTANIDFVIFPPRWMMAEDTFRPPYYHRNVMNEYMGLIYGVYDAKTEGFVPGGSSLHNCMNGHGPEAVTFEKASTTPLKPEKQENTLAFMIESRYPFHVTKLALETQYRQKNYLDCWKDLRSNFQLPKR
jgi:homogentisate 1,2-dioxygenase